MTRFGWRDGDRWIEYGAGASRRLAAMGWDEFDLLTTRRADPGIRLARLVSADPVPIAAAALLPEIAGRRLVAWGGGRVIDVAKAIASVSGAEVCAVPTTLSGAPMTSLHRKIEGHEAGPSVRPVLVLADPDLMCSMPEPMLRASAMNALAHGAEALYGPRANPVATMAALRGAQLLGEGDLALGALLCGYAVDSAGYALHHVLGQTTVRVCGTPHAETYAALLPHTMAFMVGRAPKQMADLAAALAVTVANLTGRVDELSGGVRLALEPAQMESVAEQALARGELADTPGRPVTVAELVALLAAAASAPAASG
ncbi:MAG: maleylacetate reductase [Gaiellales bacterium]|jgi:alcohol dehydrogenase class IV|nr:maleylacetate reductase [Gaiellales bacterium]